MADVYEWYNYATEQWETAPFPETDEEAVRYIPQRAGLNLYRIYREVKGLSIPDAMTKVLDAAVGEPGEPG